MKRGLRTVVYDDTILEDSPIELPNQGYEKAMPSGTPPMDNVMPEIPGMEDPSLRQIELAEGGTPAGKKTEKITRVGRPVYETPEGEMVSEQSRTLKLGNLYYNVPSIHDGKKYTDEQLVELLDKNLISPTSVHSSLEGALDESKFRSSTLFNTEEDYGQQLSAREGSFADGGVVQREGFAEKGFVQNLSPQDKSRIENVDKIADVFKKAYEKDDVSLLFKKTSTNPNGLLSDAAAINFNKNVKDPYFIKQVAQKLNIKTEEVFDLIDERQNFYELDIQPLLAQKTYQKETKLVNEFIDKGENWLIKNSKNYDNVKDLKRGFKRIFGKDHPFLKNSYVSKQGFTKFNDLFFPDIAKSYRESGNPAYTYTKKKLNNLFEASLYNFNPSVRTKVLNELESIIPKKNPTQGEAYDLRKKFKNSKILKEFNINERLDGPITRLLIRDLGENIVNDINFVRYPRSSTKKFIKFMSDRVSPQYKKQFNIISNAIDDFEKNLSSEAKNKLKIVENINYEHKIPKSVIEQGYADEIEYAKITPVGEEFNVKIKNRQFDGPLSNLTRKYTAASSPEEKKEIVKKMNDLKDNFNKRYNNYLGDITIQETNGKLNFSSKAKVLESSSDIMKKLENNLQKNPELFKSLSNFGSKLSSFGGSLDPDTIKQAIERLPAKQRNLILGAASKLRGASNLGLAAAAELTTGSTPLGVAITALFSAPILIDKLGEGYSLGQSLQDVGSMLTFDTIEELDVDRSMAEKYGGTKAAEGYDIKILTEKMADIQNKLSQLNSEQNQFESDPQYAKLVGKEELFRIQRRRKVLSDELANMEKQYQAIPDKFEKYTAFKDIEKYRELEKNIRKREDVLYRPFSLDETVMGFDDPRDEEEAQKIIKEKKLLKKFEYEKPKQSLKFWGGLDTSKILSANDLINEYAYGGRVNFEKGGDPKDKPILPINPMIGGEDPRGSLQDPGRRDVLKGMGLLGAGVAAGKLGLLGLSKVAKKAPLTEIVAPMGKTTTEFPTWFPSLIKRVREEGTQIPIFKKAEVPLTEAEFNKLQKEGAENIYDRYRVRTEEYIKASQARGEPRYIQIQDTDEIIGYRYEVKEMPGLKVKEMEGKEIEVEFPNAYGQEVFMNYTKPKISIDPQGQKIKYDAEFYVDDGVPELNWMGMQDDHHVDFYGETVKNIDEVLGGASKVEQYALKAKKPRITQGDEIVSSADARANYYDLDYDSD